MMTDQIQRFQSVILKSHYSVLSLEFELPCWMLNFNKFCQKICIRVGVTGLAELRNYAAILSANLSASLSASPSYCI